MRQAVNSYYRKHKSFLLLSMCIERLKESEREAKRKKRMGKRVSHVFYLIPSSVCSPFDVNAFDFYPYLCFTETFQVDKQTNTHAHTNTTFPNAVIDFSCPINKRHTKMFET